MTPSDAHVVAAPSTRTGRITITVLLLLLPLACLALALTSDGLGEKAWLLIAAVNLVLPALLLRWVWRSPDTEGATSETGSSHLPV